MRVVLIAGRGVVVPTAASMISVSTITPVLLGLMPAPGELMVVRSLILLRLGTTKCVGDKDSAGGEDVRRDSTGPLLSIEKRLSRWMKLGFSCKLSLATLARFNTTWPTFSAITILLRNTNKPVREMTIEKMTSATNSFAATTARPSSQLRPSNITVANVTRQKRRLLERRCGLSAQDDGDDDFLMAVIMMRMKRIELTSSTRPIGTNRPKMMVLFSGS